MDDICAQHDKCLDRGKCGTDCDKDMCKAIKKGGFCRWNDFRCKSYATAARVVMCNMKPNKGKNCR